MTNFTKIDMYNTVLIPNIITMRLHDYWLKLIKVLIYKFLQHIHPDVLKVQHKRCDMTTHFLKKIHFFLGPRFPDFFILPYILSVSNKNKFFKNLHPIKDCESARWKNEYLSWKPVYHNIPLDKVFPLKYVGRVKRYNALISCWLERSR